MPKQNNSYTVFSRQIYDFRNNSKNDKNPDYNFDYYIHWLGLDRRHDCWLDRDNIRVNIDEIDENDMILRDPHQLHDDDHANMDEEYLREHEEATKLKTIKECVIGNFVIQTWYFSPYPKEFQNIQRIYTCEFCLVFFK